MRLILVLILFFLAYNSEAVGLSDKELKCLARNIYYEARSEEEVGQLAVALTTLNRYKSDKYPDNICRVIHQKRQFSWVAGYKRPDESEVDLTAWRKALKIARKAIRANDITNGATHYHHVAVKPQWSLSPQFKRLKRVGKHVFYREKKE